MRSNEEDSGAAGCKRPVHDINVRYWESESNLDFFAMLEYIFPFVFPAFSPLLGTTGGNGAAALKGLCPRPWPCLFLQRHQQGALQLIGLSLMPSDQMSPGHLWGGLDVKPPTLPPFGPHQGL